MAQMLLLLVVALTVGAVVFGVMVLVSGSDPGLRGVEPDGRSRPLPGSRPLVESDVVQSSFDMALRGYRMSQVDQALKRVAYDIGYKDELIGVLNAEVEALREGRVEDADVLRAARLAALGDASPAPERADGEESAPVPAAEGDDVVIELGQVAAAPAPVATPVVRPETDTEVPDGPFAPWPAVKAEAAEEPAASADDEQPSDDDPIRKVATRG